MAVSAAQLKARFPEFAKTEDSHVTEAIADAAARTDVNVWGDRYDVAVRQLAAHLLAISPWGQQAKLSAKDGSSTYLVEYERMVQEVAHGYGLI